MGSLFTMFRRRAAAVAVAALAPVAAAPALAARPPAARGHGARVVEVSGRITASALAARIEAAPRGPVVVRPAPGASAVVTGTFSPPRARVTLEGLTFTGDVVFGPGDDGGRLLDGRATAFGIFGPDDITIRGNRFDGRGVASNNMIWDRPAGNVPERFRIQGNAFTRFYGPDPGDHSEALFVGYSADGLIEGNTFDDNGTTSHIFFTWFGSTADPGVSVPRDVCVRGNAFGATHGAYYDVNLRDEITPASGIRVDPAQGASVTDPGFAGAC